MFYMDGFSMRRLLRQRSLLRDLALQAIRPCLLAITAVVSTACAGNPAPASPEASPEAIAREAVAGNLGIAPDQVRVISSEAREFADASLGCPGPGMAYAQVITPGHRVIVEANGRRFDVRVAGSLGRICQPRKASPQPGPGGPARPQE